MQNSKKIPEAIVVLKLNDNDKYLQRVFDRKTLEDEHHVQMEKLKQQKIQEREQARAEQLANLEEG